MSSAIKRELHESGVQVSSVNLACRTCSDDEGRQTDNCLNRNPNAQNQISCCHIQFIAERESRTKNPNY